MAELRIDEMIEQISMRVRETHEKFIFESIRPYCEATVDMEISKDDLTEALMLWRNQKTGHWIESKYGNMLTQHRYYCSVCEGKHTDPETGEWQEVFDYKYAYCPLCGAKMEG